MAAPGSSGVLLHGDLLGQNLRISPDKGPSVIDWRFVAVGDPAAPASIPDRGWSQQATGRVRPSVDGPSRRCFGG